MPIDWNKPVQTRNGRKVRILCTDADLKNGDSIVGIVADGLGNYHMGWTPGGHVHGPDVEHSADLINVPEERFVNIYRSDSTGEEFAGEVHASKDAAVNMPASGYCAHVGTFKLVPA